MQQSDLWNKIFEAQKNRRRHIEFKDEDESIVEINFNPIAWDGVVSG